MFSIPADNKKLDEFSICSANVQQLTVISTAFGINGNIPVKFTGRGEDLSPILQLSSISTDAKSITILLNDNDHPIFKDYNHWLIWNLPPSNIIPEGIPHGAIVPSLGNAVQGIGYGKHRYRGPKPPKFVGTHRYQFHIYVLDCMLNINSNSHKKQLLQAMEGHVLQYGSITGHFKS